MAPKGILLTSFVLLTFFCSLCTAVELIVPVGIEGNDTVTFIRENDGQGNYDMGYNENVLTGGASFHRERGYANGTRTGSYGYTTRNGLIRIVTYVADLDGYRAQLLTNEPGVMPYNPSNVTISKEQEPDPAALAEVPTGYLDPEAASSDAVRDYVLGGSEVKRPDGIVEVASPFGSYKYVL